ncbi:TauD/TfdA family dioxygenase [Pseudomonas syringae]|uniref:TauD/TfdA family dioxygenase n=1 Tax=Pseudomonas syringae TaxID=317 RepID=UPI000B0095F3|nr:TauD/TfdA family dioxygenase [Pseudomonas syringae]
MDISLEKLHEAIAEQGYISLDAGSSENVAQFMQELAAFVGGSVVTGRVRRVVETLDILDVEDAPMCSLSRYSGAGAQPWHVDGSHRTVPPRYLIFGCCSVTGDGAPPTQLIKIKSTALPLPASFHEVFVVRNGRSSFYSTIASKDRPWIRFDPGCMKASTQKGHVILKTLESLPLQPCINIEWTAGKVLVIDNWFTLHRRGNSSGLGVRTLLRISLKD